MGRRNRNFDCPARRLVGALLSLVLCLVLSVGGAVSGSAQEAESVGPYPGTVRWPTDFHLFELVSRLQHAATENGLQVVATTVTPVKGSAPATVVIILFHPGLAASIAAANPTAAIEAPIHILVTEAAGERAAVTYRAPTSILALYDKPDLDKIALELDQTFARIIEAAVGE